jgi:ribosomal-protein-alanine N-acetyltransferase
LGDAEELHRVFLDREVRRYLLDDQEMPRAFTEQVIEDSSASFAERGAGIWALRERRLGRGDQASSPAEDVARLNAVEPQRGAAEERPIVGFVGFREFFTPPELQLLYGLLPGAWGRGYATEASHGVIDYAFADLGFAEVIAATDPPNVASLGVMRRLGLRDRGVVDRDGKPTVYAGVTRAQWEKGAAGQPSAD